MDDKKGKKVKQMRFYAIRKSPQNRSTIPPLFIGPYAAANNTALLA